MQYLQLGSTQELSTTFLFEWLAGLQVLRRISFYHHQAIDFGAFSESAKACIMLRVQPEKLRYMLERI